MGDLLLVRHGETEWSRSGQHTSHTDLPLTPHGEEQAKSLAPLLSGRPFALVLTSPLGRAVRTAELAGLVGAVPDADLREWDYGGYEGVTSVDIHRVRPGWDLWTDGAPPGAESPGESPEQAGRRADRVLSRVEAALPDGDVVLVAHGHFLRVVTARRLGLPPSEGRLFQLATGTLSRLSTEHGHPVVAEWNTRP
ncbi:histidine phosphatase family protein [Streptomyces griseoviridis]|uniref:Phosphatase n=3 Tax=Streptomyces TaxID=1883 RepID=A0A918LFS6_STRGD|nr:MULTISPECIES: histidine phosphatase family protein [Streptomyces]MDP9685364.1 putative phosphoglycerate mutase [Streptomyces griseoviridis]GGS40931.1 phosphatase [Streptomyces niveoruber]GGS96817.1 phosphatase [Streptomyces griseoviridis]GGU31144.1 phosphatase [Streptomyces daghestanicus]GHI32940.1 phosphatase [Streptomyces daghestanicus]